MFRRSNEELLRLQDELLAAEEEEYDEEEYQEEDLDLEDYLDEDLSPEEYEEDDDLQEYLEDEEEEEEPVRAFLNRYGRDRPKKFDDDDFFEDDVEDTDVLYRKDYQKAKRKKARKNLGLIILAILELLAIAGVILWWSSWAM